jgi:hypothetical protein
MTILESMRKFVIFSGTAGMKRQRKPRKNTETVSRADRDDGDGKAGRDDRRVTADPGACAGGKVEGESRACIAGRPGKNRLL